MNALCVLGTLTLTIVSALLKRADDKVCEFANTTHLSTNQEDTE